jgi:predicted HicB family RNase H-like nuclease
MTKDVDAALLEVFGPAEPAREAVRRGKAEGKMAVRPDDGRRKRATGRTVQFNVMMKPNVKEAIAKAAHRAGKPVTEWIELAALAYIGGKK